MKIENLFEQYDDNEYYPDLDAEEVEQNVNQGHAYHGRDVIWLGYNGKMVKAYPDMIYPIQDNIFYPEKLKAVKDKIEHSPEKAVFFAPYGMASIIDLIDIKESQEYSEQDLGHRRWTTGEEDLDEYIKNPKEWIIENVYLDSELWVEDILKFVDINDPTKHIEDFKRYLIEEEGYEDPEDFKVALSALSELTKEVKEMEDYKQQAVDEGWGDLGRLSVQIRDGNHRAFGAIEAGEPYVWVIVAENQIQGIEDGHIQKIQLESVGVFSNPDGPKELHMYDFDNTLFKSPHPPVTMKNKGAWWSDVGSLSEPVVPQIPGPEWWIQNTVSEAQKSIQDPNVHAVVITGRKDRGDLRYRIAEILQSAGLNFDGVYLNNQKDTRSFKIAKLREIIRMNPSIEKVVIWEDRGHHLEFFLDQLKKNGLETAGNLVSEKFNNIGHLIKEDVNDLAIKDRERAMELYSQLNQLQKLSIDSYESGNYDLAEEYDTKYDEVAEELESFLSGIDDYESPEIDDWESGAGVRNFDENEFSKELAQAYAEFLDMKTSKFRKFHQIADEENFKERLLGLAKDYAYYLGGQLKNDFDVDQLFNLAKEEYENQLYIRKRYEQSK